MGKRGELTSEITLDFALAAWVAGLIASTMLGRTGWRKDNFQILGLILGICGCSGGHIVSVLGMWMCLCRLDAGLQSRRTPMQSEKITLTLFRLASSRSMPSAMEDLLSRSWNEYGQKERERHREMLAG